MELFQERKQKFINGHVLFEMPSIRLDVRSEIKSGDPDDRDRDENVQAVSILTLFETTRLKKIAK